MKEFKKQKLKRGISKGMSLIEIVVAIGISVITMTGAAVFSTELVRRSQENFVEISMLQLQSIITEQLRLVESGLKLDVAASPAKHFADGTDFLARNKPANVSNVVTWENLCTTSPSFYNISLPTFDSGPNIHQIYFLDISSTGQAPNPPAASGSQIPADTKFAPVMGDVKFGAINNTPTRVSIRKEIRGTGDLRSIVFSSIIYYKVINNKNVFTKPQEIRFVYDLVCKQP